MNDLHFAPVHQLAEAIRERRVSAVEVLDSYLAQINRHNRELNAIVTLDADGARKRAEAADAALAAGELWGLLHGVPITLKDVFDTAHVRTTMGTAQCADRIPEVDSLVAARLKAAGAVLLGKTNCDLFPDNPFGKTKNPWNPQRSPGGSSSGAGAALAAGLTGLDVGSDLGGSVLGPSHFTGVCGMRPTENRIPLDRFPVDPVQLWHIVMVVGPMARSVADLKLAMQVLAGADTDHPDVAPLPWREVAKPQIADLRIAWAPTLPGLAVKTEISAALERLASEIEHRGARVENRLPEVDLRAQVDWVGEFFTLAVGALGTPPSSLQDYFRVLDRRNIFIGAWERFFVDWDALLCPVGLVVAQRFEDSEEPINMDGTLHSLDELLSPTALPCATGHPSVVIPLGRTDSGLPFGAQLIGKRYDDERLLAIAELLEGITGGFERPPGY
jgi:amidase